MLGQIAIVPNLSSTDIERTRQFYEDTLGLKLVDGGADAGHIVFQGGDGTRLFVYVKDAVETGDHTALSFWVDDVVSLVDGLRDRGVTFEEYDMPGIKTENGIATSEAGKVAWFKDPDGHIIALYEM